MRTVKNENWKVRVLTLLFVLTAVTMSLGSSTMAKYVASASAENSARVAKWQVELISPVPTANGIVKLRSGDSSREFNVKITNNSEVAATPNLSVTFGPSYGDMDFGSTNSYRATVTLERQPSTAGDIAPGESALYKMTVAMPTGLILWDGYTTAYLAAEAVQVD